MNSSIPIKDYKSNIYKFYVFSFIMGIHTVRGVYIPFMMEWGGLTFFQIMLLQSYFMFMIFLLEIPSGAIADHIGRNIAMMLAGFSVAAAAFVYSITPNLGLFFLAETLWAFSSALFSGTNEAFLFNTLKTMNKEDNLPHTLGRIQTINLIALTFSAPIGSIIAEYVSLQFTMTCLGFIYIGAFCTSLTFREPGIKDEKRSQKYLKILKDGFNELKSNRILKILCFDRVFIGILTYFLFWTYQIYLGEIGIPLIWYGFITALMNVVNMLFSMIIPWLAKSIKKKILLLISVDLISGFRYFLFGFTTIAIRGI